MPIWNMAPIPLLEKLAEEHRTDPHYEVDWTSLQDLLKIDSPLEDQITRLIDNLSLNEREMIRKSIGYFDRFCPLYQKSRGEWLTRAQELKGAKLDCDEVIMIANKHRIYFALTHPRGMDINTHNVAEEEAVYNLLLKVKQTLGRTNCAILGYCFESDEG